MEPGNIALYLAAGSGFLALALATAAHRRITSARRSLHLLQSGSDAKTIIDVVADYLRQVRSVADALGGLEERQDQLARRLSESSRNVGVVRYDAFEDMGGQMSFSAALLDDDGDGVVFTSINGRMEARTYAKVIDSGRSDHHLSPEEMKAISEAMSKHSKVRRSR